MSLVPRWPSHVLRFRVVCLVLRLRVRGVSRLKRWHLLSFAFSGDTRKSQEMWSEQNRTDNVKQLQVATIRQFYCAEVSDKV